MYSFSVTRQLIVFIQSFSMGMILSAVHSAVFFLTGLFTADKKKRYIISDIIFSILMAFMSFCFVLSFNLGSVRFYLILGVLFGVLIYELSFGQTVLFLFEKSLSFLRRIFHSVLCPFIKFFRKIFEKISKKIHKKSSQHIANKKENVV